MFDELDRQPSNSNSVMSTEYSKTKTEEIMPMQARNINLMAALVAVLLVLSPDGAKAANLLLTIDKTTGSIDWVDGFSITKTEGVDDNRFGSVLANDAFITSPLLLYTGNGVHNGVRFDFSPDGTMIQGIGLFTTLAPENPTSFAGTPAGLLAPTFTTGGIAQLMALTPGNYTLDPFLAPWSGGIDVQVVPEPGTGFLCLTALGMVIMSRARYDDGAQEPHK